VSVEIGHEDWAALTHAYGEVLGELAVYKRVLAERDAEIAGLRTQLAACADEIHKAETGGS
jgi:hypothetical protein